MSSSPTIQGILDHLSSEVDGGCAKSIESIIYDEFNITLDILSSDYLHDIDEAFFECDVCGWTMPVEELSENDDDSSSICIDCSDV